MNFSSVKHTLIKTLSWRISGSIVTIIAAYLLTGKMNVAIYIGGVEIILKSILYFLHEIIWERFHNKKQIDASGVIWLTGLSGAGKTTISNELAQIFIKEGIRVEQIDGDNVREIFPQTGFTRDERNQHIKRIGHLASRIEAQGVVVIASFISPYQESRDFVKNICRNYYEVYINTPLEECIRRDPKGLYKKALAGTIKSFTGIDDPYEAPINSTLVINTQNQEINIVAKKIYQDFVKRHNI
jgi:adenylylsulfate kinase